jgi:release factor glutamine methyltransferase
MIANIYIKFLDISCNTFFFTERHRTVPYFKGFEIQFRGLNFMTIRQILNEAKERLGDIDVSNPALEVAWLYEKQTGIKFNNLPMLYHNPAPIDLSGFWNDIARRSAGEPLQYILGEWEFYGLNFKISKGVLIPRADTEVLVEVSLEYLQRLMQPEHQKSPRILDLCIGSGCISVAIAMNCKDCNVWGVDISDIALDYAKQNINLHGVQQRVFAIKGDMLTRQCDKPLADSFDLIVCNPPYISTEQLSSLDESVKNYEPLLALDGGSDGLDFYRAFSLWLPNLKVGGMAAFEVVFKQSEQVAKLLAEIGLHDIFIKKDYAGVNRIVGGLK